MKSVDEYTVLAAVYDQVMEHVDYEGWVDYILYIIGMHRDTDLGSASHILELGCGTGLFTEELVHQCPTNVLACDASKAMLDRARIRFIPEDARIEFEQLDFETGWNVFQSPHSFDAILLLYDCVNYIHTERGLAQLFEGVQQHLAPGTVFVFDQSTPANSVNNAEFFEDEGGSDGVFYVRKSTFDEATQLHSTDFEITTEEGVFHEKHVQRTWTYSEMRDAIEKSGLEIKGAFDGFSLDAASDETERIHWVVAAAVDLSSPSV